MDFSMDCRPENTDAVSFFNLYQSYLTNGVDLDDLIFNGEEYYHSER